MMKKILALSSAMFFSTAVMASATDLSFIGNSEYQIEAETFELNAGVEYVSDIWTVSAIANSEKVAVNDYEFTGFTFGAAVEATNNFNIYGIIETDGDVDYEEATVGVAFRF